MKKKVLRSFVLLFSVLSLFLCAFTFDAHSSVKSLTHPYINTYECTRATLGNTDLLEKYEYFKITILDTENLEVAFKKNKGKKHVYTCKYDFNEETRELSAEIGILGFRFRQKTVIEKGKFTVSMPIFARQLIMNFEAR